MDSSFTKLFITFVIFVTSGESYKIIHENNNSIQYHASYSGNENMDSYNERISPEVFNQKMPLLLLKLIVDIITYKETKVIDSNISKESAKAYDRILVTTGYIGDEGQENGRTSEVIDMVNPNITCNNLESAPNGRWASVGGLVNRRPLICGGFNGTHSFKDCFSVQGNGINHQNISMTQTRSFATSVVLTDQEFNDYLWVVGGYETKDVNTTEFVYDNKKAVAGPTLPFIVAHHCMVQVSDNAIYIIGGKVDGEISNQVWIADPTNNFEMKKGPPLQEGRYFFSCAVFQDPDSLFNKIVVAGGYNQSRVDTNSVEILDPFPDPTISNKWEYGPSLPTTDSNIVAMVTSPDQKGVIGSMGNILVELRSGATNWKILSQRLKYGRKMPVIVAIPNDLTSCGET